MSKVKYLIGAVTFSALWGCSTLSCADNFQPNPDKYFLTNSITCGGVGVKVSTTCFRAPVLAAVPGCQQQTFLFNQQTGETVRYETGVGFLVDQYKGAGTGVKFLNALASGWQCVKNENTYYLIVAYTNGGNCETCEYYEIIDMHGTRLSFSSNPETAKTRFYTIYRELALPQLNLGGFTPISIDPE